MQLSTLDLIIIVFYIVAMLGAGIWISKLASSSMEDYFLGGNKLPWWTLGLSNASGMFDVSGTMWMVYLLFIYGLKSVFIPWLWPSFNQIFMMVFLSIWLRRSGVMTGAEWIRFRFGESVGATLSHLVVVAFALLSVLGFLAYSFIGIGKFASGFFPWELASDPHLNEIYYGLIFTFITSIYVVKGGMFSVVLTEVLQFIVMTIACILVGVIAMVSVSPEAIYAVVPNGWQTLAFGWALDIDWSAQLTSANQKIAEDGYDLFTIFIMLVLFKGILQSLAGPAPNYDMQRILSAKSPKDAAKVSALVNVVMLFPRYMLITGLTVLALAFHMDELRAMNDSVDFEQILPFVIRDFIPQGLLGLLLAGLLAAYMSTFAATANAAPAYVVNDLYKRFVNNKADPKTYVYMSYLVTILFIVLGTVIGLYVPSLNQIILWMVSALYGGYTASNLLKWYWWRFNGVGYFAGMLSGILAAVPLAFADFSALNAFPLLFLICFVACVTGSLLTKPDNMDVLKKFYLKTRPWGFWTPVLEALQADDPLVRGNTHFKRDTLNVVVGVIWQTSLTLLPIFMVIKNWTGFALSAVVIVVTSLILKKTWYDTLEDYPVDARA